MIKILVWTIKLLGRVILLDLAYVLCNILIEKALIKWLERNDHTHA